MADEVKEVKPAQKSGGACGFENKQYTGEKKMFCTLPKDHAPVAVGTNADGSPILQVVHSAPYPEDGSDPKILVGFSDAAGVPFSADVQAKLEAQREQKKAEAKASGK